MPAGPDEAVADLHTFGAPPEVSAALEQSEIDETTREIWVWPENWDIVMAFCVVNSQLRVVAGMSSVHYVGLDYAGVEAGLRGAEIKATPELWAGLRVMESATCAKLNERHG